MADKHKYMEEPNILIKQALNDAVNIVNSGVSPTGALSKVASMYDLNPNYVQRVGEALNVALHYNHFKSAEDRASDFPTADIVKVAREHITASEKTAAEYISDNFASNEAEVPSFNFRRAQTSHSYKQAVLKIAGADEAHDSFGTSVGGLFDKAANYISKLERNLDNALTEKIGTDFELNSQFSKLADHYLKDAGYRGAFDELESQAFSKYGEQAVPYLDLLYKTAGIAEERGSRDAGYVMFEPSYELGLFDSLMKTAEKSANSAALAKEAEELLEFEREGVQGVRNSVGAMRKQAGLPLVTPTPTPTPVRPGIAPDGTTGFPAPTPRPIPGRQHMSNDDLSDSHGLNPPIPIKKGEEEDPVLAMIKKKAEAAEKQGFLTETIGSLEHGLDSFIGGHADGTLKQHFGAGSPQNTSHAKVNNTLENMERKLILQELLMTDPILSKVNPAKVARAYEQLLRLAPQISKEKEIVRAELRGMVASQALSKYDADLMTKLDTDIMKHRVGMKNFMDGNTEHFKL